MKNVRLAVRLRAAAMVLALLSGLVLAGCGNTATETKDTTAQTVPETTQREVAIVGKQLRHMTYNIAGSNTLERIPNFDLNEAKRANIKRYIEEMDPDTFGIQEAPKAWVEGMVGLLDHKYAMVGGSFETINNEKFWFNPIYYKVDIFNCLDSGVMFLDEGFVYNKNNRNAAFALLERKEDGELVLIFSLHLEHRPLGTDDLLDYNLTYYGKKSSDQNFLRDYQIEYLCKAINTRLSGYAEQYSKEISVIVSGDFNIDAWSDESYTHEYTRLCETLGSISQTPGMRDSATVAVNLQTNQSKTKWQTYRDTFTFESPYARLDYIFVSGNLVVDSYTVFDTPDDMGDSSDHHPTYIDYHIGH